MKGIKKEPHPAKDAAQIGNTSKIRNRRVATNSFARRDARVIQFLKSECNRREAGAETLSQVFTGLLSVHNRQLNSFAEALKGENPNA